MSLNPKFNIRHPLPLSKNKDTIVDETKKPEPFGNVYKLDLFKQQQKVFEIWDAVKLIERIPYRMLTLNLIWPELNKYFTTQIELLIMLFLSQLFQTVWLIFVIFFGKKIDKIWSHFYENCIDTARVLSQGVPHDYGVFEGESRLWNRYGGLDLIKKHSERWRWLGTSKYSDGSGFLNAKDNTLRVNIKLSTVDKFSNAIEMNLSNILVCTFYKLVTRNLKKSHLYPISWTPLKLIYQFSQSKIFFT